VLACRCPCHSNKHRTNPLTNQRTPTGRHRRLPPAGAGPDGLLPLLRARLVGAHPHGVPGRAERRVARAGRGPGGIPAQGVVVILGGSG